jgi:hypothetical protein
MTANQKAMIEKIAAGKMGQGDSIGMKGRTLRSLIHSGKVSFKHYSYAHPETTYHGRRIPGAASWGGLFIKD